MVQYIPLLQTYDNHHSKKINHLPSEYLMNSLFSLKELCRKRLSNHFRKETFPVYSYPKPAVNDSSPFAKFVRHYNLQDAEMALLLIALVPHLIPGFFDALIHEFLPEGGEFPEFGGLRDPQHRSFIPTGETTLFILAGMDMKRRLALISLFGEDQPLFSHNILTLESVKKGTPILSGRLSVEQEFVEVFVTGRVSHPKLSIHFPAQHISTQMEWDDLVLNGRTIEQIKELESWIRHHHILMNDWDMNKKIKPGYRALFYGPPGTGKTMTATLLGKYTNRDVFRIDLSMVVSKFIGETEKNLASLFDKAEHKNWILFFDEADALFGKRTGVRDAHDKYANQEVSYLLQRVEIHPGLVILASNFKGNIDEAFIRRFNSVIYFPPPDAEERLLLWEKGFPTAVSFASDVDLQSIASEYTLTGSHIINIIQFICLNILAEQRTIVTQTDILRGIRRELEKEGK